MTAWSLNPFNHAVSFVVSCDDQAEVDRYWDALLANGGSPEQCGSLKNRFGLFWQMILGKLMAQTDKAKAKRAADAMLKTVKIDIAALEAAVS